MITALLMSTMFQLGSPRICLNEMSTVSGIIAVMQVPEAPKQLGWDYPEITASLVTFELCIDDLPCVKLNPSDIQVASDAGTKPGDSSYAYPLPPLKMVTHHQATLKTCNKDLPTLCQLADPSTATFDIFIQPGTATRFRAK